nr:MAG TPA: hypothetical protein [Caudoviricetes sp.]
MQLHIKHFTLGRYHALDYIHVRYILVLSHFHIVREQTFPFVLF